MHFALRALIAPALAIGLGPAVLAQTTWVVDDNGTGDFVHIQDAVDAAQDGDVISVLDGAYAGFTIDAKALVVAGEPGGDVQVAEPVVVRNVGAAQRVELDNLRMGLSFSTVHVPTLSLEDNDGSVRLVDCEVVSQDSDSYYYFGLNAAVSCLTSVDVGILRSTLVGADGDFQEAGTSGLFASDSSLVITGSTLVGGDGGDDIPDGPFGGCAFIGGPGGRFKSATTIAAFETDFVGGFWGEEVAGGCSTQSNGWGFVNDFSGSSGLHKTCTSNGQPIGFSTQFEPTDIAAYCFGTWEECPCGNNGAGSAGCETAYGSGGVELSATGTPSVSADTVTLVATGLNPNASPTGLFFQGDDQVAGGMGTPFNDGLLCVTGGIRRLKGKLASGGSVSFGFGIPNDSSVSVRGQVPAGGGTRRYQLWFRHQAPQYCTTERFHMSNAVEITWLP